MEWQLCDFVDLNGDAMMDLFCGAYTYVEYWNPQAGYVACTYLNTGKGWQLESGGIANGEMATFLQPR